jgi:hypothetical protein
MSLGVVGSLVNLLRPCLAAALMACGVAWSAPVGTDDSSPATAPATGLAAGGIDAAPATVPGTAQTVDLLIQMQPRAAGAEFDERTRKAVRPIDAGARPVLPAAAMPPSALFGAGADPAAARGLNASTAPGGPTPSARMAGMPAPQDRAAVVDDGKIPLPAELVRFVREHRVQVVIGSVLLLALVWGGSIVRSNRRRR